MSSVYRRRGRRGSGFSPAPRLTGEGKEVTLTPDTAGTYRRWAKGLVAGKVRYRSSHD